MRLINADALIDDLRARKEYYASFGFNHKILAGLNDAIARIEEQPTIEPERKNGKWIETDSHEPCWFKCDQCGRLYDLPDKYCPSCGADMRGEQE